MHFTQFLSTSGGARASCGGIRANQGAKAASNAHCFGPGGWPKHTANAVRLRTQAGFSTSHVSSRLVIRLLKRRYHKQIRDAALHFHETKKHVGKFQRAF